MAGPVAKVMKIDIISFTVLQVMNELEQVEGDQVFEPRAGSRNQAGMGKRGMLITPSINPSLPG